MDKFLKRIILITVGISLISLVLINVVLKIPNKYVVQGNDWIGFYGSFVSTIIAGSVGGVITYKGVKETIEANRADEEERWKLKYRPIFQIKIKTQQGFFEEIEENKKYSCNFHDTLEDYKEKAILNLSTKLCFENIGEGYAGDVKIRTFIDGKEMLKQHDACYLVVGKNECLEYYVNGLSIETWKQERKIKVSIECKDIFLDEYTQTIEMHSEEGDVIVDSFGILEKKSAD